MSYIKERERKISRSLLPSAMPLAETVQVIDFPPELAGCRVLDIGGGASNATAWLRSRGAEAYAVDRLYGNLTALEREMRTVFTKLEELYLTHCGKAAWQKERPKIEASYREFMEDYARHASFYVHAFASSLPFPDGFFDMAFSTNCITHGLDKDFFVMKKCIEEGLRVVKAEGNLQIYPFSSPYARGTSTSAQKLLGNTEYETKVEQIGHTDAYRLRIIKS